MTSAVDLSLERDQSKPVAEGVSERIDLRTPEFGACLLTIVGSGHAICRGLLPVSCRALAVGGNLISVGGPLVRVDLG